MIRITVAVNRVSACNPDSCMDEMLDVLAQIPDQDSDIIVFPKLSLCSASCGSLFKNPTLIEQCASALVGLQKKTQNMHGYIIVGLATEDWGKSVSAMAVLHRGELIALIPTRDNTPPLQNSNFSEIFLPDTTVFACGGLRFCVLGCSLSNLVSEAADVARLGCDLLIIPAYAPVYAGFIGQVSAAAKAVSASTGCAVAIVNGGIGDTSAPCLYTGFLSVYECGELLAHQTAGQDSIWKTADLDMDVIRSQKKSTGYDAPLHQIQPHPIKTGLFRPVSRRPFLPVENTAAYLDELYDMQVRSLSARMQNIGISRLVIGVSGGIDSTAALLVCAGAIDLLGLPRENVLAVAMPGPGTTARTTENANALMRALGVSKRVISIEKSTLLHLEEIGHSGRPDTAYENAQARERTQILLDIANMLPAIVVGTGDLSEAALGFTTFAGDHIANYNVNACITKSVLRALLAHLVTGGAFAALSGTVGDVLDTPVSPELLPMQNGEQKQKTEELLGPYDLHEFFLYYLIKYHMRPYKIFQYACAAFGGVYHPSEIKDRLSLFIGKFCAAQFKRACAPESASITEVNLSPSGFYIPSDLDPSFLLGDLDAIHLD